MNGETAILGDLLLSSFYFLINELFNASAIDADQMVVMMADLLLKDRLA